MHFSMFISYTICLWHCIKYFAQNVFFFIFFFKNLGIQFPATFKVVVWLKHLKLLTPTDNSL